MTIDDGSLHNSLVAFTFLFSEKGYPGGSVVFSVGGDEHFVPGAAIIDPESGLEIAFLELPTSVNDAEMTSLARSYEGLLSRKEARVPVYLISTSVTNGYEPRIFNLSPDNQWMPFRKEDFPTFSVLSSLRTREHAEAPKRKAVSTANDSKKVAWSLAVFLLILLIFDFCQKISISQVPLWLLLGVAVLFLLPYFSIIRALGFELQRNKEPDGK
jgi:hypothetical protein